MKDIGWCVCVSADLQIVENWANNREEENDRSIKPDADMEPVQDCSISTTDIFTHV